MANRQPPVAPQGVATAQDELRHLQNALGHAVRLFHLEPIEALGRLEALTPLIAASRFECVRSARINGRSWSDIASVLAISQEQAELDFGSVDRLARTG